MKTLNIKRILDLPVNKVWKAWSDAETFKKWWGPTDYTCPDCTINFDRGGHYLACMKSPEGKETWSTGKYKEIILNRKIVFTDSFSDSMGNVIHASSIGMPGEWPLELSVKIELEEVDGKTHLSLNHTGIPEEMQKDCTEGWQQSFDKLEKI